MINAIVSLLLNRKAIFLHVPKTGGSWVNRCAEVENILTCHLGSKHADLTRIEEFWRHYPYFYIRKSISLRVKVTKLIKQSFKFCFVRHPYEWIKSFYRFQTERNWPDWNGLGPRWSKFGNSNWHPTSWLHDLPHSSFNEFLNAVLDTRPGFVYELYSWYTGEGIDYVGKQENLSEDLIEAFRMAELSFDAAKIRGLDRVNVSQKDSLNADPDLVRRFHLAEYSTLHRFGYSIPANVHIPRL